MTEPRVIVTRRWPEQVKEKLKKAFDVERNGSHKPFSEAGLKNALSNVEAVFPAVTDAINAKGVSAESMGVRLIGNFGVG